MDLRESPRGWSTSNTASSSCQTALHVPLPERRPSPSSLPPRLPAQREAATAYDASPVAVVILSNLAPEPNLASFIVGGVFVYLSAPASNLSSSPGMHRLPLISRRPTAVHIWYWLYWYEAGCRLPKPACPLLLWNGKQEKVPRGLAFGLWCAVHERCAVDCCGLLR